MTTKLMDGGAGYTPIKSSQITTDYEYYEKIVEEEAKAFESRLHEEAKAEFAKLALV